MGSLKLDRKRFVVYVLVSSFERFPYLKLLLNREFILFVFRKD